MPPGAFKRNNHSSSLAPKKKSAHGVVIWLSVAIIALIAYGSLYPFDFKPAAEGVSVWQALGRLTWARAGRSDRISNVLLYAPLGFCLFLSWSARWERVAAVGVATMMGALLSFSIEVAQVYISSRVPSWQDVVYNVCGAVGGALGGLAWRIVSKRSFAAELPGRRRDIVAAAALGLWFVWRWAPFEWHAELEILNTALRPLLHPELEALAILQFLAWWLAAAFLLMANVDRARATELLLTLIATTLVGRLFFIASPLQASEAMAVLLLLPALAGLHKLRPRLRETLICAALIGAYISDELQGWRALNAQLDAARFDFWPFMDWLRAGMPIDLAWLSRRLFQFVTAAWLLRRVGCSERATLYWIVGGSLVIECARLVIARQTASLTEPALALAALLCLRMFAERGRAANLPRERSR